MTALRIHNFKVLQTRWSGCSDPSLFAGDLVLDKALSKVGGKSLFTKELEIALDNKTVDFVGEF